MLLYLGENPIGPMSRHLEEILLIMLENMVDHCKDVEDLEDLEVFWDLLWEAIVVDV